MVTVEEFRAKLEKFAKDNDLVITNIKGWTEGKIEGMAADPEHRCCCDPKNRACPCELCVEECKTEKDHMCLCSIFRKG